MRRYDGWAPKVRARKGQATGRMSYMKTIQRRAKNHFREENTFVKGSTAKKNLGTRNTKQIVKAKIPKRRLI